MAMRQTIRFLLGNQRREVGALPPTTTVLNYLRLVEGLRGTKEGCGEGDCGACTVVLGEPDGDRMRYRALNACIQLLPTLDGKQLITVEHLRHPDGSLHPVQQALVQNHGSQCGFCTVGFVMSLFALYQNETADNVNVDRINDALAGNLCRCTGYGTIIQAGLDMYDTAGSPPATAEESEALAKLRNFTGDGGVEYEFNGQRYISPTTIRELVDVLDRYPDAVILAGATDVGLWITKQLRHLETVVYIGAVSELRRLTEHDGWITVGAGATQAELRPVVAPHYPDFAEILRRFGGEQVRNVATLCGNVANGSPIGDSAPTLIALGAKVTLRSARRQRTLPLEDFFIDYGKQDRMPGEFVESVSFPVSASDRVFRAYKVSKRFDQDISAVCGAFNLQFADGSVKDVRICYGGMAAIPKRAANAEAVLTGSAWTTETVKKAINALEMDYRPIDDMRASATYRMKAAQNLLQRMFYETTDAPFATRLVGTEAIHAT